MKIIITKNYDEMSEIAAKIFDDTVREKIDAVLGLATGSSPLKMYALMAEYCKNGTSYKKTSTYNLDEYIGLPPDHVQSYAYFMKKNLFDKLDIDIANTSVPNGVAKDIDAECKRYDLLVSKAPADLQVLGIGSNGHIGFNEPKTSFDSHTHAVKLAESTVKDNSRLFSDIEDVPKSAITMGIKDILGAKKIIVLASGKNKADAVYNAVSGPVSEDCPASVLQTHPDVIFICDREAAAKIE